MSCTQSAALADLRSSSKRESNMGSSWKSSESALDMAIANWVHAEGLNFHVTYSIRFQTMLWMAWSVGPRYNAPQYNEISGKILEINYNKYSEENMKKLEIDADVHGLSFLGDGATIKRTPFINVLFSAANAHLVVLDVIDCSNHLKNGGKKDAIYIQKLFVEHLKRLDPKKNQTDVIFFDGEKNVQKAGECLTVKYPCIHMAHGVEHCLSLFLRDVSKIECVRVRVWYVILFVLIMLTNSSLAHSQSLYRSYLES